MCGVGIKTCLCLQILKDLVSVESGTFAFRRGNLACLLDHPQQYFIIFFGELVSALGGRLFLGRRSWRSGRCRVRI